MTRTDLAQNRSIAIRLGPSQILFPTAGSRVTLKLTPKETLSGDIMTPGKNFVFLPSGDGLVTGVLGRMHSVIANPGEFVLVVEPYQRVRLLGDQGAVKTGDHVDYEIVPDSTNSDDARNIIDEISKKLTLLENWKVQLWAPPPPQSNFSIQQIQPHLDKYHILLVHQFSTAPRPRICQRESWSLVTHMHF